MLGASLNKTFLSLSLHFIPSISFLPFHSFHFIPSISFLPFHSFHFIPYVSFLTFHSLRFIHSVSFIPFHSLLPVLQSDERATEEIQAFFASHVNAVRTIFGSTTFTTYNKQVSYSGVTFLVQRSKVRTLLLFVCLFFGVFFKNVFFFFF